VEANIGMGQDQGRIGGEHSSWGEDGRHDPSAARWCRENCILGDQREEKDFCTGKEGISLRLAL